MEEARKIVRVSTLNRYIKEQQELLQQLSDVIEKFEVIPDSDPIWEDIGSQNIEAHCGKGSKD